MWSRDGQLASTPTHLDRLLRAVSTLAFFPDLSVLSRLLSVQARPTCVACLLPTHHSELACRDSWHCHVPDSCLTLPLELLPPRPPDLCFTSPTHLCALWRLVSGPVNEAGSSTRGRRDHPTIRFRAGQQQGGMPTTVAPRGICLGTEGLGQSPAPMCCQRIELTGKSGVRELCGKCHPSRYPCPHPLPGLVGLESRWRSSGCPTGTDTTRY